jgi:lipopolysaccharide export system permease protein
MRLHDRYLFRELLTPLAFCLGAFFVFWLSFFFFTELEHLRDAKLHFGDTVEYAAAKAPEFFVMVLPIALLLALLYALTQHAKSNELTALRAAGISLWRLCAPYFVVGLLATGIYFGLNEFAVPWGTKSAAEILNRYVKNPEPAKNSKNKTVFTDVRFLLARANRLWVMNQYDAKTTTMINPNATWTLPDGSWRGLLAERAVWTNGAWTFSKVQFFAQSGKSGRLTPQFSTNEITMPEFVETPLQILLEIKFSETDGLLASRNADIPLSELWPYLKENPDLKGQKGARLLTKFHARLAAPWTCFIVVLMAIPFGAQSGRRNLFFGVAGSIFICFGFFILQSVSLAFGMGGHLPGWLAAWLPNLIFAVTGVVLTARVR